MRQAPQKSISMWTHGQPLPYPIFTCWDHIKRRHVVSRSPFLLFFSHAHTSTPIGYQLECCKSALSSAFWFFFIMAMSIKKATWGKKRVSGKENVAMVLNFFSPPYLILLSSSLAFRARIQEASVRLVWILDKYTSDPSRQPCSRLVWALRKK